MQCPNDKETLQMTSREGIEIDYCPKCRGVWLDRGELDKIIERTSEGSVEAVRSDYPAPYESSGHSSDHHRSGHDYYGDHTHRRKKREGLLGNLFDF